MSKRISFSLLAVSVALVSGCSLWERNPIYGDNGVIRDRSQDYEQAQGTQRLQLPSGMQTKETHESLVIPQMGQTAIASAEDFKVPRPEFFYIESGSDHVNLRKVGAQKEIVVDEPIASVWLKLKDFWSFNNIQLASADPRQGVMVTDWIKLDGEHYNMVDTWLKKLTFQDIDGPTRNKLRVSVRPDPNDYQRTSITLKHVQFPMDDNVQSIDWETQGVNVAYKSDMLFEMLRYMSKASEPTEQSLVALQNKRTDRPQLGRDSRGNPVLRMNVPIDQAWTQLNKAIDESDIDAGTRDQNIGKVYLTYTTSTPVEDEKMGFFEWINSDREDIKLNTDMLGIFGDEDKEDAENAANGITYTSGKTAERMKKEDKDTGNDVIGAELGERGNQANSDGYKIWFAGKVVYVFGGGKQGVYNENTDAYEYTARYQLQMNRMRTGVYVTVLTDQGIEAPAAVAEEILWAVKDHLPSGI